MIYNDDELDRSSSHLRFGYGNVSKASDLNFFQYASVRLIEFIIVQAFLFSTYSRTASMKLVLLRIPAVNADVEILHIATFACFCMFKFSKKFSLKKYNLYHFQISD